MGGHFKITRGRINFVLFPSSVNIILVPVSPGNLINCVTSSVSNLLTAMRSFHHAVTPQIGGRKHLNTVFLCMGKCKSNIYFKKINQPSQHPSSWHHRAACLLSSLQSFLQSFLLADTFKKCLWVGFGQKAGCEDASAVRLTALSPAATKECKKYIAPLDHKKHPVMLPKHFCRTGLNLHPPHTLPRY